MPVTFQEAHLKWVALKAALTRGEMDRAAYLAAVKEICAQDEKGRRWQMDPDTGKWAVWNGKAWIPSSPPVAPGRPVPAAPGSTPTLLNRIGAFLSVTFNPGAVLQHRLSGMAWPLSVLVPAAAFTVFFLQTGLDMWRVGRAGLLKVALLTVAGGVFGTVGIAGIALAAWAFSRLFGSKRSMGWAIGAYALAYGTALVYGVCGLAASLLLGWKTALAFGATGVLWTLRPMMAVNDDLVGRHKALSVLLTVLCGALVLFTWGLLCRF